MNPNLDPNAEPLPPESRSQLMNVFSAAFQQYAFTKSAGNPYEALFEKYMGERWAAPVYDPIPFPSYDELVANHSPIVNERVLMGTWLHAPYCYLDDEGYLTGWEYEMAEALRVIIFKQYPELRALEFEWVLMDIPDSELPMDGSDNDVVKARLVEGLENGNYHCVFSGVLIKRNENDPFDFSAPTSNFYVSGVYTGRGEFGTLPTGSFAELIPTLAGHSTKEEPIRIVHTANPAQAAIGANATNWIINDPPQGDWSGHAVDWDIHVPVIPPAIEWADPHLYIGDIIQIMVMGTNPAVFPNIQNLHLNFDGLTNPLDPDCGGKPDPETPAQPMTIGLFALNTT